MNNYCFMNSNFEYLDRSKFQLFFLNSLSSKIISTQKTSKANIEKTCNTEANRSYYQKWLVVDV